MTDAIQALAATVRRAFTWGQQGDNDAADVALAAILARCEKLERDNNAMQQEADDAERRLAEVERDLGEVEQWWRLAEARAEKLEAALRAVIEEFACPSCLTGYDEDDPVVLIARAAIADAGGKEKA